MPRRVEDIRPSNHRSIRDVPKRTQQIHISKIKSDESEPISAHKTTLAPHVSVAQKKSTGLRWFILVIGIVVVFAGLGYIASVYFSRASFVITPKIAIMDVSNTFSTQDSAASTAIASGTIPYSFITVHGSASTTVPATVGPAISTKAQGPVTIYNSYSSQAQRLIAGTRLANASGKVYRLAGSVVVPGYTVSSKSTIPGSVNATIIADQPGDLYNITGASSISDFKMISYEGSSKYNTIYARITAPVVGGMTGTQSVVDPSVIASTTEQLKTGIITNLLQQIHSLLPQGYIMYDSGYTASFSTTTSAGPDKTQGVLTVQCTMNGMIFKKVDFLNRLASTTATASFGSFKYNTSSLESLNVTMINSKSIISLKIKGTITLVGIVPVAELTKKILGKTSDEAHQIFKQYAQVIEKIDGDVMPQWSNIPMDPSRVSVTVSYTP